MLATTGLHAQSFGVEGSVSIEGSVINGWNQPKSAVPVVINLKDRKTTVASAEVIIGNQQVAYQLDDLDGDTHADELVFLVDLAAKESKKFKVTLSSQPQQQSFEAKVYADMMLDDRKSKHPLITSLEAPGDSYLYNDLYHHGAAFENELVAYRIYFDQRQNIDIFGKKLRRLELADTHFYTTPEQMQQDYGNDVLWAGNSVGCGSFKGWNGTAPANIEPVGIRGQRIIAAGPLRTIVEVKDMGWMGTYNMTQRYTLYAGHRECEVSISFDRPLADDTFCTGVQKIGPTNSTVKAEGWVHKDGVAASWGSDYPEMGKKEQFPPETVGLAVYVPTEYIKDITTDELNYLFLIGAAGQQRLHYYVSFCADKENEGYHSANEWFKSLDTWKEGIDHPAVVKYNDRP